MRTPKVVETVLGRDVATFDREFMVWLGDELAWVGRANPLQTQVSGDSAERLLETAGKPDADVATRAEAAAAAWAANRPQQALTLAEQIIATATDTTAPRALALAHHVRAAIRHRDQDADGARADLERVVALGFGGLETQLRLAGLARVRGDHGTAAAYLDKAVELAPKDAGVWLQLADARQQAGATDAAFAARARAVAIDQADHRNTLMLLEAAVEHGAAAAQVEAWAEQLLFIRPFDLRVHTVIARTATAMGLKALAERAHGAAAQLRSP
jgi:tetratricopeptide (TPR) repeat protein